MVRIFAGLVGLFFSGMLLLTFLMNGISYIKSPPVETVEEAFHLKPHDISWSFNGPFGTYDKAQLQRGFQVYKEVCSACHSLSHVHFRDLADLGYNPAEIKAIAKNWQAKVSDKDPKTGDVTERPAVPSDLFPTVYYAGQGTPPDLSMIAKARSDGPNYVHSLLTGFQAQPAELLKKFPEAKTPDGLYYNPYFANLNLAMPPPLTSEGQVTYGEGQPKPTVDQMSKDVSAFLMWAAEPKMEQRKETGIAVVIFLLFATVLAYMSKQVIWSDKEH